MKKTSLLMQNAKSRISFLFFVITLKIKILKLKNSIVRVFKTKKDLYKKNDEFQLQV